MTDHGYEAAIIAETVNDLADNLVKAANDTAGLLAGEPAGATGTLAAGFALAIRRINEGGDDLFEDVLIEFLKKRQRK